MGSADPRAHRQTLRNAPRAPGAGERPDGPYQEGAPMPTTPNVRPPPSPPSPPSPAPHQPRLLVVDDHLDSARVLARVLGLYGFDVTTASGRDGAVAACDGQAFDLLFTDIELGEAGD